jgi:hypothetical protein
LVAAQIVEQLTCVAVCGIAVELQSRLPQEIGDLLRHKVRAGFHGFIRRISPVVKH